MTAPPRVVSVPFDEVDAIQDEWAPLNPCQALDRSLLYLRYRAGVDPGRSEIITVRDGRGLRAAAAVTVSTPRSGLFGDPWAMLADDQLLRLADLPGREQADVRRSELVDAVARVDAGGPVRTRLAAACGPALVVRSFDSSEIWTSDEQPDAREALLAHLQRQVGNGAAGAIAFPFVDPADTQLRLALVGAGFVSGVVTASSTIPVPPAADAEAFVAGLPKRRRRRYRTELSALAKAGLRLTEIDLAANVERVAALEAATMNAHGGRVEATALAAARRRLLAQLGEHVRVPAALDGDTIVACGVDLFDEHDYYGLTYGADPTRPDLSTAYMCVGYYEPLFFAVGCGLSALRCGFEAFVPKVLRGAAVTPREMWLWVPDDAGRHWLAKLLELFDTRTRAYLSTLGASRAPDGSPGGPTG